MPKTRTMNEQRQNRENLETIARRAGAIVSGLEDSSAWKLVLEDFGKEIKRLDDTWQYIYEDKEWYEYRITKMAAMKVANLIEDYKHDLNRASEELKALENPATHIQKDIDNEGEEA